MLLFCVFLFFYFFFFFLFFYFSFFCFFFFFFFFSSRRRHTRFDCDWSSDVCSSDLIISQRRGSSEQHAAQFPRSVQTRRRRYRAASKRFPSKRDRWYRVGKPAGRPPKNRRFRVDPGTSRPRTKPFADGRRCSVRIRIRQNIYKASPPRPRNEPLPVW